MKKIKISISGIALIFFFIYICFLMPFLIKSAEAQESTAQGGLFGTKLSDIKLRWMEQVFRWVFGFPSGATIGSLIIFILLFLIFAFAFYDILTFATPFSDRTNKIIAFSLSLIAAMARLTYQITATILAAVAGLGGIGVALTILACFAIFFIVLFGSKKMIKWALRKKVIMTAIKKAEKPAAAWEKLKAFEEATK